MGRCRRDAAKPGGMEVKGCPLSMKRDKRVLAQEGLGPEAGAPGQPIGALGASPVDVSSHGTKSPLRVLLVEDVWINRENVAMYLRTLPCEIEMAENGEEAVDKFTSRPHDLVFMDMEMPVMDGYTATRLIREWERESALPSTPIIALTAHCFEEDRQRCLDAGCNGFLSKPAARDELMKIVSNMEQAARNGRLGEAAVEEAGQAAVEASLPSGITHELKNALGAVLLNTELVLRDIPEGDMNRELLKHVVETTHRLRFLLNQVLPVIRSHEK